MQARSYMFNVGDFECTVLLDGNSVIGRPGIKRRFPNVPEADSREAYQKLDLNVDTADDYFNILLARIGDEVVLIDAGEGGRPKGGHLLESMEQAGITPESVTLVVITHAHGDHIQGLISHDNGPVFPNATYVISREEMAFWRTQLDDLAADQRRIVNMIENKGLRLIDVDEQILPGLTAVPLPGHTPGHIALLFESGNERLIHMADLLLSPMQFAHPEWSPVFDADTSISVPTRRNVLKRAADENWLTLFYHLPFPGLGWVRRQDNHFVWVPVDSSL